MRKNDVLRFIGLYKSHDVLWNLNLKEYRRNDLKMKAYESISIKMKMSVEEVKKKIKSLRTAYSAEKSKVERSKQSGCSIDSLYVPTLFWFNEMSFIDVTLIRRPFVDNSHQAKQSILDANDDVHFDEISTQKAAKRERNEGELLDLACKRLRERKEEFYHWAMACAADLQKMEKHQQLYAKKAIAEILMEGQLGLLHRHSVQINEAPSTCAASVHFNPSPSYSNSKSPAYNMGEVPMSSPSPSSNIEPSPSPPYCEIPTQSLPPTSKPTQLTSFVRYAKIPSSTSMRYTKLPSSSPSVKIIARRTPISSSVTPSSMQTSDMLHEEEILGLTPQEEIVTTDIS